MIDILDNRVYSTYRASNIEIGDEAMAREKFKTLTEQMFYVLLCLREEYCGIDILSWIPEVTGGRVTVGSGTLYHLLETFLEEGMIEETKVEGRKRSYRLTAKGQQMLDREYERLHAQAEDYRRFMGGMNHG